jgi:hypothetical protein
LLIPKYVNIEKTCGKTVFRQRTLSVMQNITFKWFLKKLAHMFKWQFNYCVDNCPELMRIGRYQLEDNISR